MLLPLGCSAPAATTPTDAGKANATQADDKSPVEPLKQAVPREASQFTAERTKQLREQAGAVDEWAAAQFSEPIEDPDRLLAAIDRVIDAKAQVDEQLEDVLALRTRLVGLPPGEGRREAMRQFLRVTTQLIDLSGRLRYELRDAIDYASFALTPHPDAVDRLIEILTEKRVSIGAAVMTYALFDPPPETGLRPFPNETRRKVLDLIAATRQGDLAPQLAQFVRQKNVAPELILQAAEVFRETGLPQDAATGESSTLPPPPITARELHGIVSAVDPAALSPELAQRRGEALAWLDERAGRGVRGDVFRCRGVDLREGDWLLMQNPSPYNMFTDLSPGLFTHVGIVSAVEGDDGIRRFVIVDMPERGARIPAGNVDAYLEQTLHFFFLRHEDPAVQKRMGEVARQLIGNETQFDLTFKTDRVLAQKGQPLKGRRVHTYCAGFLLMCAQETSAPREDFFPVLENPAGGHCLENLKKLGLSIGKNFVSPTSALFSPKLEIVARREPMYSPGREVMESVYDEFAHRMIDTEMMPAPDLFQSLRQTAATAAKTNPWLAQLLAKANNVSAYMDLESAAKAAAVIETLDQIALSASNDFRQAHDALLAGPVADLKAQGVKGPELERIAAAQKRHAALLERLVRGELSPHKLRVELVEYYKAQGRRKLDERFFSPAK